MLLFGIHLCDGDNKYIYMYIRFACSNLNDQTVYGYCLLLSMVLGFVDKKKLI